MGYSVRQQAFDVFDELPEREQVLIFELIKSLLPDDVATPDDIAVHNAATDAYRRGEYVLHEDI